MAAPKKPAPYLAARVVGAVMMGLSFFILGMAVGALILASLGSSPVELAHGQLLAAAAFAVIPVLAGHSACVSFPDAFAQGRFELPAGVRPPPAGGARSPWSAAIISGAAVGLPAASLAIWLTPALWGAEVSRLEFLVPFAVVLALLAGGISFVLTGERFLREAAIPAAGRRYSGTVPAYLLWRHFAPQALINLWINAWIGLALVKGPIDAPEAGVAASFVPGDVFVTGLIVSFATAAGCVAYARFDLRWGVMTQQPGRSPSPGRRAGILLLAAIVAALMTWLFFRALGIERLGVWPFVLARGIGCALYAGAVAYAFARWSLIEGLPERLRPAESPELR